jgi:tRNA pseudouridine55 synthase
VAAGAAGRLDGVLLLDKPPGYTSTKALARAKRLLGAKKSGHTGTLDPFATGLLPLVFGEATKFSRFLIDSHKAYDATLRLGIETATGDPEGEVTARFAVEVDEGRVDEVLRTFLGFQDQVPPMHSAVHVNGRRLYEYARNGEVVERPARHIEVGALRRLALRGDELDIAVTCSKGTYIRTLAMDIGRALGSGASLVGLRRTAVGPFFLGQAVTMTQLEEEGTLGVAHLLPTEILVAGLARHAATEDDARRFSQGQEIPCESAAAGSEWALYGPGGRFLGVGLAASAGRLAPLRLMATGHEGKSPDFA